MAKFKRVIPEVFKSSDLETWKLTCSSTKCESQLHCFSRFMKKAEKKYGKKGVCYECGDGAIDWPRMHKNDINDSKFIFDSLNKELIRYIFWQIKIEKIALENAKKLSKVELRAEAEKILRQRIKKYNPFIDNRQTPLGKDNIINYAQHASGTCCRKCMEAWHGIPKEQELTTDQLKFCTDLVMKFIEERLS